MPPLFARSRRKRCGGVFQIAVLKFAYYWVYSDALDYEIAALLL